MHDAPLPEIVSFVVNRREDGIVVALVRAEETSHVVDEYASSNKGVANFDGHGLLELDVSPLIRNRGLKLRTPSHVLRSTSSTGLVLIELIEEASEANARTCGCSWCPRGLLIDRVYMSAADGEVLRGRGRINRGSEAKTFPVERTCGWWTLQHPLFPAGEVEAVVASAVCVGQSTLMGHFLLADGACVLFIGSCRTASGHGTLLEDWVHG